MAEKLKEWITRISPNTRSRASRSSNYHYECLKDSRTIRLLLLKAGKKDDPLHGHIEHIDIGKAPKYHALSYAWENDTKRKELCSPQGCIPLTLSLHAALKSLRDEKQSIWIWADALCINQADDQEKGHQIGLMREIYCLADRVIVYLGRKKDDSDFAMQLIREKNETPYDRGISRGEFDRRWFSEKCPTEKTKSAIKHLFYRPWFTRRWIVQELFTASTVDVVCGNSVNPWNAVSSFIYGIRKWQIALRLQKPSLKMVSSNATNLCKSRDIYQSGSGRSLLNLLDKFRDFNCKELNDQIFSLVGIASNTEDMKLRTQELYTKSFEELSRIVATLCVDTGETIEMLEHAGLDQDRPQQASWIPDFSKSGKNWSLARFYKKSKYQKAMPMNMVRCEAKVLNIIDGLDILEIDALFVDIITSLIHVPTGVEKMCPNNQYEQFFVEVERMLGSTELASSDCELPDLCCRVSVANYGFSGQFGGTKEADKSRFLSYKTMRRANVKGEDSQIEGLSEDESQQSRSTSSDSSEDHGHASFWYEMALRHTQNLARLGHVGITEKKYAATLPLMAEQGDEVVLFPGGRTPFVVRRDHEKPGYFRLVGEAYVHGIMDGEAMGFEGIQWKGITLC